ncbi:MAG: nicotinate-nucleotide--dimethylbenzimidazole phosphoribosyltransferase [Oxalicibacterium faecigallinarum]|uniref:nicotinate-nucleotide--dimethylbenzimidazole phosphoribosyltransferase n=1 Tax=Oxalicibacterium faecigallinarum TaxID=573741 RepID=UPI002807B26A|nr:nicotinate-nucleotide--dimethylbenzimidazole phosphoribosyltransferase [Oxalicibacterium faecigallinarum]MDQ7970241.1 nicotinate-nucleotide--dimethylbenzimidazole phosphoribosyltransferase [Oxalicibacterium faecigallinarum]
MFIPSIQATDNPVMAQALRSAIDGKTKPPGSLGMLEKLAHQIGMVQQTVRPAIVSPALIVFAGDHGIVEEKISAYPQSVTWQMVENFLAGGAAINVFARQNACALHIVDAGVNHDFGDRAGLLNRKVAAGTRNFATMPAMTAEQCTQAMQHGAELIQAIPGNVLGFGEMGIGNTTSAAAIMHALTGLPAADCVGAGTGLSREGILHKQQVVANAVAYHASMRSPLEVLMTFGGFEIAMIAGAMLAAAERRMVLVIDGFIITSALLVAARLQPAILDYCVFAHCSDEYGHAKLLAELHGEPVLHMGLRLGEGTGAVLVLPMLQAAVHFLCEMATFESAAVSNKSAD